MNFSISIAQESTGSLEGRILDNERSSIIHANKPVIDPTSTANCLNLNEKVFENLPLQRNYKSLISLSPLATENYYGDKVYISGSTGWENSYFIDGTNVLEVNF